MAWVLGWVSTHIDPPRKHDKIYVLGVTGKHITVYKSRAGPHRCKNRDFASRHAEMHFMETGFAHRYIVVVRFKTDGSFGNACPCADCCSMLKSVPVKVYCTNADGKVEKANLNNTYRSLGTRRRSR